jgi:hypothetical protein
MLIVKGNLEAAIEHSQRIIELYPNYPGGYEQLATAYLKQRRSKGDMPEESHPPSGPLRLMQVSAIEIGRSLGSKRLSRPAAAP